MATQFFEQQDRARRNTSRLVSLFCLAVVTIVLSLYVVVAVAMGFLEGTDPHRAEMAFEVVWFDPLLMLQVGVFAGLVIGGASLYRISQLSGGGRVVAEGLRGRLLHSDAAEPLERRILNVVEEMAIASGTPIPPVYLMDRESGINAFAAGFSPSDAVIGVTHGCVEQLSRDELQGVVAHEFSHILNGDMRLNIRLMGALYGILVIGVIGRILLRVGGRSRRSRNNSTLVIAGSGMALMVMGFLGTLIGNLIKASVSRQREFLADASAVQFTRNPSGIAGALKKIGGFDAGSQIESPGAAESSHIFFGRALSTGFDSLFATHPPLAARIKILDPSWQGAMVEGFAGEAPTRYGAAAGFTAAAQASSGVDQIGQMSAKHLDYAAQLLAELPPALTEAARDSFAARAVVYALLLDADAAPRSLQLEILDAKGEAGVPELTRELSSEIQRLGTRYRLPLIDMVLPALRELSIPQYRRFKGVVEDLVEADQKIGLFEWTLQRVLLRHLAPSFEGARASGKTLRSKRQLQRVVEVILSTLVRYGTVSEGERQQVVNRAGRKLVSGDLALLPPDETGLEVLDHALELASSLTAPAKERLLRACAEVITADDQVSDSEAELFRAIGDCLGCPIPPLLPGQALA